MNIEIYEYINIYIYIYINISVHIYNICTYIYSRLRRHGRYCEHPEDFCEHPEDVCEQLIPLQQQHDAARGYRITKGFS